MLDVARAVWSRRKWVAVLVFLVPFAAVTTVVASLPNIYESTATVLVERQQVPEALVRSTVTSELETRLRTISQDIFSRSRLEPLIARFGLYPDLRPLRPGDAVVERMRTDIRLDLRGTDARGRGSTIAFAISYRGRDPETVAHIANTLASFYIEEDFKIRERQASSTAQFLDRELQETRKRLDEQERLVSEFKKRHVGELPQQMAANLSTVEQLNAQLRLNSLSLMRLNEKRDLVVMQLPDATRPATAAGTLAIGDPDPAAVRLGQLKQQLEELTSRFTERHPSVMTKTAEIAALQERIARDRAAERNTSAPTRDAAAVPAAPTPHATRLKQALGEIDAEIKVLTDEGKRLRNALAMYEQRVANTPRREQEFQELSRDYESTRELYQSLVKRHDEALLAESMEQRQKGEQFRILDPALPATAPAAPNRPRLMALTLALCLAMAAGAVVAAEQIDTSFHSRESLRAFTTVPIVASIPRIVTAADGSWQRWRFRLAATGTVLLLVTIVAVSYLFSHGNERLVAW